MTVKPLFVGILLMAFYNHAYASMLRNSTDSFAIDESDICVNDFYISTGFRQENDFSGRLPPQLEIWCAGTCVPTDKAPLFDGLTGERVGFFYSWAKDFIDDGNLPPVTVCFSEFLILELGSRGRIYLESDPQETCGVFADPALIVPVEGDQVVAGGSEGKVVGGTKEFRHQTGNYTTRLYVEFRNAAVYYYDELFFRIAFDN